MHSGHGKLSQDANGANSASGERVACAFHVQLPALGANTRLSDSSNSPKRHFNFQSASGKTLRVQERRQNHLAGPDDAVQTLLFPQT